MRTLHALALVSTMAIAASGFTSAASSSDEKEIRALYAKLARGLQSKNVAMVESTEAPGFTQSQGGKTYNAAQSSEMMKEEFKQIKKIDSFSINVTAIKVNGKKATGKSAFAMTIKQQGRDKKPHTMVISGTSDAQLVKTAKGWLFLVDNEKTGAMTMDGKPMGRPQG